MIISSTLWLDARGYSRVGLIRTVSSGVGPILTPLQAVSNASWTQCWEGPQSVQAVPPIAAPYESGLQVARLVFASASGEEVAVLIYAPKIGIFLPDGVTVDIGNPQVVALVGQVLINGAVPSGAPITHFISGMIMPTKGG